jgi:hypothetical protein
MTRTSQRPAPPPLDLDVLRGWLAGRLPEAWFTDPVEVVVDRDEITVVGQLADPEVDAGADLDSARRGRATAFREQTRAERMAIARSLEAETGRSVSWGVTVGAERFLFTNQAVPVMTRLRQPERQVLDTLVASGVARSRADALAWCVRLVAQHTDDWLAELTAALGAVEKARAAGPDV